MTSAGPVYRAVVEASVASRGERSGVASAKRHVNLLGPLVPALKPRLLPCADAPEAIDALRRARRARGRSTAVPRIAIEAARVAGVARRVVSRHAAVVAPVCRVVERHRAAPGGSAICPSRRSIGSAAARAVR